MIHIFALTQKGFMLGKELRKHVGGMLHCPSRYLTEENRDCYPIKESLPASIKSIWGQGTVLIMIMATGIVVRSIKDLIEHKSNDPAVLVMDQEGQYVIPLLSGHLGGGNAMARKVSEVLQAEPVITTATDVQGVLAIDEFAKSRHMAIDNIHLLKKVSAALLDGEKLLCYSTIGLHEDLKPYFEMVAKEQLEGKDSALCITEELEVGEHLVLHPKNLVLGIGCRKGTKSESIRNFINKVFEENNLSIASIAKIVSVSIKGDEKGILEVSKELDRPFNVYSTEELDSIIQTFNLTESTFVKEHIGIGAVCEPSAILGSDMGELIVSKCSRDGMTVAVARYKHNMN